MSEDDDLKAKEEKERHDRAQAQFAAAVKKQLSAGAKNWSGDDTEAVVNDYLLDEHGNSHALSPEDNLILRLAVNPTVDRQVEAVKQVFERAGKPLNEYQLAGIRRVLNPQTFRQALIDAKKIKAEKRARLGKLEDIL